MALTLQTVVDGPRNVVVKAVATLTTADQPQTTIVTVANLMTNVNSQLGAVPAVDIMHVDYSITDQLEVQLLWGNTTSANADLIMPLAGRGRMSFVDFGGIPNSRIAGWNGNIDVKTTGWTSGTQIFTIILEMVKRGQTYGVS
jgi:hypothetical protein